VTLTVATLNVNGLRSAEKRGFSRWLARARPDWLCLQELRATPEQVPDAVRSPAGYNARWLCPEDRKGYAGVALYSREAPDRYVAGSGLRWGDAEGRCLRADLGALTVVSLYVPSGSSSEARQRKKQAYLRHIASYLAELLAEGRPALVCGDVNIAHTELDIHAPKRNEEHSGFLPVERRWLTSVLARGWVDVVRALHPGEPGLYSWWSNFGRARAEDRGWRIDYVLATPDLAERATRAWIEKKAGLSDHAPVWAEFES
jgi:exodeoxyribonuclease-3